MLSNLCRSALLVLVLGVTAGTAMGQGITFSTTREVTPPDYATFRIGNWYSTFALTESVGYRYTTSSGTGTDYLDEKDRGEIKEDGSEFPILSALTVRSYIVLSRNLDVDVSFRIGYYYYPLDTQESEYVFDMADEGIFGNLSSAFRITEMLTGTVYDNISYRTDYIDTRGLEDENGGSDYERFENTVGLQMNWIMGRNHRSSLHLSRYDLIPSDDEFDSQERYQHREAAFYRYQVRRDMAVGLRADYRQTYYTSTNRLDTEQEDYSLYLVFGREGEETAGVRITKLSTLRLSLGMSVAYTAEEDGDDAETATDDDWEDGSLFLNAGAELETLLTKRTTQVISYERGLRDGFNSPFEEYDGAAYRLRWTGDFITVRASSKLSNINPNLENDVDYRNWVNSLGVAWRVYKHITIDASSTYVLRDNDPGDLEDADDLDAEDTADYETLANRIGTSFGISKDVTFSTYYLYTERFSDDDDLEYTRDTFQAMLTYHHQF